MARFRLSKIKLLESKTLEQNYERLEVYANKFAETIRRFLKLKGIRNLADGDYKLPREEMFYTIQKIQDEDKDIFAYEAQFVAEGFRFRSGYFLPFGFVTARIEPITSEKEKDVINAIQEIMLGEIFNVRPSNFYTFNFNVSLKHESGVKEHLEGISRYFWYEHYVVSFTGNKIAEIVSESEDSSVKSKLIALIKDKISSHKEIMDFLVETITENYPEIIEHSGGKQDIIVNSFLNAIVEDIVSIIIQIFDISESQLIDFTVKLNEYDILPPESEESSEV
jgi:hypothetical protein